MPDPVKVDLAAAFPGELLVAKLLDLIILLIQDMPPEERRESWRRWFRFWRPIWKALGLDVDADPMIQPMVPPK
jgi:hypothetical protein